MKEYAMSYMARAYIKQFGVTVYEASVDQPGLIVFKLPTRSMWQLALTIQARLPDAKYTFERMPHWISDLFVIDKHRAIRLIHHYGSNSAYIHLIDDTESPQ